ncbi:MAG: gliding motility lipoprotein GldK, partial [Chryseobacterium sp.]
MKRILLILLSTSVIVSCSKGSKGSAGKPGLKGELVPRGSSKSFIAERPYGMVPIPGGSFVMGMADQDFSANPEKAMPKTVTVSSFFMDETEIT